jgi:predicted enzyme related to lactoylglutathione lyase
MADTDDGTPVVETGTPKDTDTGTADGGTGVNAGLVRPGGLSYLHIPAADARRAALFYENVFDWNVSGHDTDRPSFDDGTGHVSGAWMTNQAIAREPGFLPYIYVEQIDQCVERVRTHGGQVVTGPRPEGNLLVATFRDPEGNLVGLWQLAPV